VRTDVEEYSISEGWIRVQAGKTVDRKGQPLTLKLTGPVEAWYEDLGENPPVARKGGSASQLAKRAVCAHLGRAMPLPKKPEVVIIGRPNVGKSALFNRLAGRMISIVHDQPGVTRDRIASVCRLGTAPFEIVDTGGIGSDPDPDFAESTREGAHIAMESADVILFVTDSHDGITPLDA
jgi:predicted GTPase